MFWSQGVGVVSKADVQEHLTLAGLGGELHECAGSISEGHHTGKEEKLKTSLSDNWQVLPGSQCGHTVLQLLLCTLGATGELGVWKNWLKVKLTCLAGK